MTTTDLDIHGMTCASCVARVEGRLNDIDGVEATVNLATESAHVTHGDHVADDDLIAAVEAAGYEARVRGDEHAHDHDDPGAHLGRRLALAAPLTAIVVLLAMDPGVPRLPWLQLVLTLPVLGWAGWPFHRAAWRAARHRSSTMDTLVSIGTVAAFGWSTVALVTDSSDHSYFEVATVVTTFLLLGRRLEARSKRDAGAALRALLEAGAKRAVLADLLGEREVDVAELRPGNRVVVRPGAQVPTDAVVVDLAKRGVKRLVVLCPSFLSDCLETLEEIGVRAREEFVANGGEELRLVPCVNADAAWVEALSRRIVAA